MVNIFLIASATVFMTGLLIGEKRESARVILCFKTPLSVLFVITAIIQPHPSPYYYYCILVGLILGLIGDVCLALPGNGPFRTGLVAFLGGHVAYVAAFVLLARGADWLTPMYVVIAALGAGVFWWLRPHLGNMQVPVAIYVVVISIMVATAYVAFVNRDEGWAGRWALLAGSASFYFSDLFVARDRFVHRSFCNRLIGLPLYYSGQFLLALSVGLVGRNPI